MSSTQTQTTSFKAECWQAVHNLLTDTLKIALYTSSASLGEATTVYTSADEVSGAGYTAGGQDITGVTLNTSGFSVYSSFDNPSWVGPLTARYALLYNASKGDKSIAVLDFGADKTVATFTVQMTPNTVTTALLRTT